MVVIKAVEELFKIILKCQKNKNYLTFELLFIRDSYRKSIDVSMLYYQFIGLGGPCQSHGGYCM